MGLLSLLGNEYLKEQIDPPNENLTIISTRQLKLNQTEASLIICYGNDDNISSDQPVNVNIENVPVGGKYVAYIIDIMGTNPFYIWNVMETPVFPTTGDLFILRAAEVNNICFVFGS